MNIIETLKQYDIQEGDLLECEDGEVYMILKSSLGWMLTGPQPFQYIFYFHGKKKLTKTPKRLLRPRWDYLITAHNEETELPTARILKLEILQPKQQDKTLRCKKCNRPLNFNVIADEPNQHLCVWCAEKPTITVNVPKGVKVEVVENE